MLTTLVFVAIGLAVIWLLLAVRCALIELRAQIRNEFHCLKSDGGLATKTDLEEIHMLLSEIKTQIAQAAAKSTEAFAELGTRIGALQQQIDDLIAGASDPNVTDETFLADLQTLKTNTDQLADIVPNPEA